MLKLQNASISRGARVLIENINFAIYEKMTVGLIGANGSGKSTLFAAIRGEIEFSGIIDKKNNLMIASLEQEVPALDMSVRNYTISGNQQLFKVLLALSLAEQKEDYDAVMHCHHELAELDGYSAEARAAKILIGLGFSQEQLSLPVKAFSGGWRIRMSLAKCLFSPSDLLLLDEPTNHLDLETILWLENFLKYYPGAILIVSHDRDFLDQTVTHIAHVESNQLKLYTGNYSTFEVLRAQQIALQNSQFRKQQAHISHMMKFVERFRAKATKARQAQSRLKAIEKMELVKPIFESSPFSFEFLKPDRMPNPMLTMRKANIGYGENIVLKQITFSLRAGERIGLLGVNGAGKTTFIKSICGELKPFSGLVEPASSLRIGYFAQHQIDYLPLDYSPLEYLKELQGHKSERELLSYLGSFAFNRDQSLSPMKQFSGGEKARIALALIIWQKPNLLLMDEPTNHLDLEMREALSFALQAYEGAMILVSHDRYLMRSLVDELFVIDSGRLSQYEGSVEDYQTGRA